MVWIVLTRIMLLAEKCRTESNSELKQQVLVGSIISGGSAGGAHNGIETRLIIQPTVWHLWVVAMYAASGGGAACCCRD